MSERKVNLEEAMQQHVDPHCFARKGCYEAVIDAMREACRQVLELAAENAETEKEILPECGVLKSVGVVNKQSILDTINQVE